jgi:peptide-methionine (S)-S-oxide reductase
MGKKVEIATLAGGCFWCLEAVFDELKGVESVESGYSGGHVQSPSYAQVCNGDTGHAEVVQITFNPQLLSLRDLLTVFFTVHDPTTLNHQGNDVGTQYRSAIFYHNEEQKKIAEAVIQEYYKNNSFQPYCRIVIAPKVAKFRRKFAERLKK